MQESAFPVNTANISNPGAFGAEPGMTLRDWFAGQALAGMLAGRPDADCGPHEYALDAYKQADVMLALRALTRGDRE